MTPRGNLLGLEIELDTRLVDIWKDDCLGAIAEELAPEILAVVAMANRAAYAVGYFDALNDPEPGGFFADCGYPIQMRRAQ